MTSKDGWFLGLLALAYLYLDDAPAARRPRDDARAPGRAPVEPAHARPWEPLPLPPRVVPRGVCPRVHSHAVVPRADGALWCRGCDEGFYPPRAIWGTMASAAAAA